MSAGGEAERLPASVGALVDLAWNAYRERFGIYALLALGTFVACAAVEFAAPAHADVNLHALALDFASLLGDAFVITAVALGVGVHVAGERPASKTLLRGALYRWPGVLGASLLAQIVTVFTFEAGGIGPPGEPGYLVLAPITWLLWAALGLAGPLAALSPDLPAVAAFTGFGRALLLSLRVANLGRLAVVALATVVPLLLESMLTDALQHRGVAHALFWASVPIDCAVVGLLAALQSAFALDFARRIGQLDARR